MRIKKMTKEQEDKFAVFDVDLARIRKEHEQVKDFSKRISVQTIEEFQKKLKETAQKENKKISEENKLEFRTTQLISKLNSERFASAILDIVHLIQESDTHSAKKITPSKFKKEIESIGSNLKSILKQIESPYAYHFLSYSSNEIEIIDLQESIKTVIKTIAKKKDNAPNFLEAYDDFFIPSSLKNMKSKDSGNKRLTIICSCLNQIYDGDGINLNTYFLSCLSEKLILEMNKELKLLKIGRLIIYDKTELFKKVKEIKRSATWKSRSK